MAEAGLRVNEASHLDLADVKWDLGRFGKLHVRKGKGARGSGPRERMVPLINGAGVARPLTHPLAGSIMTYAEGRHRRPAQAAEPGRGRSGRPCGRACCRPRGRFPPRTLAYLEDRARVHAGQPQLYVAAG